jgi:hypothetical protein
LTNLCQYFTTTVDYILYEFEKIIINKNITDPFAGKKDLLNWAIKNNANSIKGYDIDDSFIDNIVGHNNSLVNIPKSDFILTNPPYLAYNKTKDKSDFNR